MDKSIQMEKHHIEAWGLWWIQWQKQTKERLLKHGKSPQKFIDTHLVSVQAENLIGNTTTGSVLSPK
ncbi:MAG: hypothetical protein EBU66_15685 [Bacteroidetes bacterium]|jgi:hypothetical protein|nr:hypothetical protein [Bacteroidota bacterium]